MITSLLEHGLIDRVARAGSLLVGLDFDGTLAPIARRPDQAAAPGAALDSIKTLAALPRTHVAVISGRAFDNLRARVGDPGALRIIGSHGAEWDDRSHPAVTEAQRLMLHTLTMGLDEVSRRHPGAWVERKPMSSALHYRGLAQDQARAAVAEVMDGPARLPGIRVRPGKMVVELSVSQASKGDAFARLHRQLGVERAVFIGDDFTDEDAFAVLGPADVGIKVGPGPTSAPFRLGTTDDVATLLAELVSARGLAVDPAGEPGRRGQAE